MTTSGPRFPLPTYTDLDQNQIWLRMRELCASVYPDLDLDSRAEIARLFLEGEAYTGDIIADLMRRKGRESRWSHAEQRSNVLAALKMLDFRPSGATAATAEETFTLASPAAASVTIQAGETVRTPEETDPVRFQLLEDLVIPAGTTAVTATVEHSETIAESYLSDGKPNQRWRLQRGPYIDRSVTVSTTLGAWSEVKNFLASTASDRHFMTSVDSQDRCTVIFGGGSNGLGSANGSVPLGQIDIGYKIGGGAAGKLGPGTLTVLDGSFADANGNTVRISVTNAEKTTGGEDRMSTARIKLLAPVSTRSPVSSVAREDYEIHALEIAGVGRALHLTRNQDPSILPNEGFLYIVPTDGGVAGVPLLTTVASQFGDEVTIAGQAATVLPRGPYSKTVTYQLRVRGPSYKTVDVFARVWLRERTLPATARASIQAALTSFFSVMIDARLLGSATSGLVPNPRIDFGFRLKDADGQPVGSLARSDLYNAVRDATGVLKIGPKPGDFLLNGIPDQDVVLAVREFPALGTITLIDGKSGLQL